MFLPIKRTRHAARKFACFLMLTVLGNPGSAIVTVLPSTSTVGTKRDVGFEQTLWGQVFAAGAPHGEAARTALESLCRLYWYPLYAFLRRWGHDPQDARDLTQGFFVYLVEHHLLRKADPQKGRFRSFLLGSLRLFLANEQAKQRAAKRGGGTPLVSIDVESADGRYTFEPATHLTPERLFDRHWALEVIAEAMRRLEAAYRQAGLADLLATLHPYLVGDQEGGFVVLAARLHKSEGAARVVVCRLRNQFRHCLRSVIADTVADAAQVDRELQDLQAALRAS